ncbi:TIGR01212 family radical SAM protein [Mobilibacterium timonense]|uniref:TIGR01212 family radical SAM protein n=1 Tax=Mobilibacterium timonense TaxID=1871012 RepID=UPI002356014D|nr:TIGR01212 family radical SAM protein [Mobilibacterium timonense]MBM6990893.1 TIGR01212 family radical SAM protein [Mobilibacterium timonense]
MDQIQRFYSISSYLRRTFGKKMVKLSLDGGFTCPNRDGTIGTGGCAFCSPEGSGELASDIPGQIALLRDKWPDAGHLAYFQSHTNTYGPVDDLRRLYMSALDDPHISGLAIATRPDCLSDEVLDLLSDINRSNFLWVELGLQSTKASTMEAMGLGYTFGDYERAIAELNRRNIRTVSHLILGLPGETEDDMFRSVRDVVSGDHGSVFGLKLHLLNVVRGSALGNAMPDYVPFYSMESYCDLVVRLLEVIPADITIHRLTGDVPRGLLISPEWSYRKRSILNTINRYLRERDTWQGKALGQCPQDYWSPDPARP